MTRHAPTARGSFLNLRIGDSGKAALTSIAERMTDLLGKKVTMSEVARDAIAMFCIHHEPLARIAARRSITTGQLVLPLDIAQIALEEYAARHDPQRQR